MARENYLNNQIAGHLITLLYFFNQKTIPFRELFANNLWLPKATPEGASQGGKMFVSFSFQKNQPSQPSASGVDFNPPPRGDQNFWFKTEEFFQFGRQSLTC
eukprot:TRINITY_DN13890_c0_g1_i1.p2 TRINITY_DN13890_c0_g1~~TRINITY_DN13890_c0_g1_i1.p2  ORF type:complete len:112 (+),score=14.75 TRINITY_DN13890_c0_g1_i1:32-337(+)